LQSSGDNPPQSYPWSLTTIVRGKFLLWERKALVNVTPPHILQSPVNAIPKQLSKTRNCYSSVAPDPPTTPVFYSRLDEAEFSLSLLCRLLLCPLLPPSFKVFPPVIFFTCLPKYFGFYFLSSLFFFLLGSCFAIVRYPPFIFPFTLHVVSEENLKSPPALSRVYFPLLVLLLLGLLLTPIVLWDVSSLFRFCQLMTAGFFPVALTSLYDPTENAPFSPHPLGKHGRQSDIHMSPGVLPFPPFFFFW